MQPVPRQESWHGSEQVPGQRSQPHQPGEGESEQLDKPSDSSMLLVLQLECSNLQGIELVVEEQTSKPWRKKNQARTEGGTLQLSQGSPAGLGGAERTFNLLSLDGGTWMGRTGKILISCNEETGETVIQRIHETAQHPAGRQSQREGATGVPEARGGAGAEKLQVVGHESWHSGGAARCGEAASGLPAASHSPKSLLGMAVSVEMVHEAQQTHSVIALEEGLWIRRRTGKLLRNKSQQTSVSALRKISSTGQEQREEGCCGGGGAAGGCASGQREGGEPQTRPADVDVPELPRHTSPRSSQLPRHD